MRQDFNKLLTESPRRGSERKFHDVRGTKENKRIDEDAKGGKVSIHYSRRRSTVRRKTFGENLNTLRRFIHTNVGRPWNKVYSEICEAFDKRKVVNDHILVHLFEYVEIETAMVNGKVCVLNNYRGSARTYNYETQTYTYHEGYYEKRWVPIRGDSGVEWYVHPVDGLLKYNRPLKTKRQRATESAQKHAKQMANRLKVISATEELHQEGGIWWLYTLAVRPAFERVWGIPGYTDAEFQRMPEERKAGGRWYDRRPPVVEVVPEYSTVNRGGASWQLFPANRYYATRTQACHKVLKANGLDGTAEFKEDGSLSHRFRAKYRIA